MVDYLADAPLPERAEPDHLLAALERLNVRLGEGMARKTKEAGLRIRGSQGRILQLIAPGGSRPTVLAEGSWITKQAMGKRIQDLEERGLVRVAPDPHDGRAVLVHLTSAGTKARDLIASCVNDLEAELASDVGASRYSDFRAVLDQLGTSAASVTPASDPRPRGQRRGR